MLILSRREGEDLDIITERGEHVKIFFLEANRNFNQVRIGVEAPETVKVYRSELLNRIIRDEGCLAPSQVRLNKRRRMERRMGGCDDNKGNV